MAWWGLGRVLSRFVLVGLLPTGASRCRSSAFTVCGPGAGRSSFVVVSMSQTRAMWSRPERPATGAVRICMRAAGRHAVDVTR